MKVLHIAGIAVRRMVRDRTALFFVVVLPFFIIFFIGSATKGIGVNKLPLGVVDASDGSLSKALVSTLEHSRHLKVTVEKDADALRAALRRSVYAAGVVIPANYDGAARSGHTVDVAFLNDIARTPSVVRTEVGAAVARQGARVQAAVFAAEKAHIPFDAALTAADRTAQIVPDSGVHVTTLGHATQRQIVGTGFGYTAPSQLVLFVFITSLAASGIIVSNRQMGITRRMYGTPTTATQIVVGETIGRFALAAFQAVYILVVGTLVFGVDWGDPLGAAALTGMFVLVGTSFAVLFGTLFRTPEQASAIGPPVGIAMGMLAGCMWPRFIEPPLMQHIGQLFPQAWAMDGFIKLISLRGGIGDILPQLAVLAAFVVVILPIATWRLRRGITA